MDLTWRYDLHATDWDELSKLYRDAPLGTKSAEHLREVFDNSRYVCFVHDGETLVGVGRALADGRDCSYICDVAVHPGHQGIGLGKQIVQKLMEFSKGHTKIILYANPGKEGFYRKLGFKMMNTAMAIFRDQKGAVRAGVLRDE
ncbi:GNAT family N-acetyltransferase [Salidesulfovibrio onnuriiensis]|uniref:GNAT family N-acetyltransferase n=1 Tax=Salidesulfovibrio onnuriiensis TaxID=2583823 RepID=UPI0011C71672|nr:GNAT family N-acetyltransferase [Salidesulfovibrio onnuriiensis]